MALPYYVDTVICLVYIHKLYKLYYITSASAFQYKKSFFHSFTIRIPNSSAARAKAITAFAFTIDSIG